MKEWIEPQSMKVPAELATAVGGHPLVAQTLARRGFADVERAMAFLDPDRYHPAPPSELPNLVAAAERLEQALREDEQIGVWGDFDADGQTSTALLVSTLRDLEGQVTYHIPHRQRESHGVNLPVLKRFLAGGVQLVLTCDTGVTAHQAVEYARTQGVDVVITDHHVLPPTLPAAHAVVNPRMVPEDHPLHHLPGVGCAYKLAEALYERAGRATEATRHLDLVALGIVADVATQVGDTRYLLQRGLDILRRTERLGLQALMERAKLQPERITEEHIGFGLAPRLNALGRLADAAVAVEFLTTNDLSRARILATELDGLNAQRKLLVTQVSHAAEDLIERDPSLLEHAVLVLNHPSWPGGVIGIVAGRLAERYQRPTVLISTPEGKLGRGSARSIEGCDITAALTACQHLLHRFGGHPMAAGMSIDAQRIPEFRRALSRAVEQTCGPLPRKATLSIDGYLSLADLSLELVGQIERLAPFGAGNPPLTLASRGLTLDHHTTVGRNADHRQIFVQDPAGNTQKVMWWWGAGHPLPDGRFDLAYTVRATTYRGQPQVEVVWVDARPVEETTAPLRPEPRPMQITDHRGAPKPHQILEDLRTQADQPVLVWAEAQARARVDGQDRRGLAPAPTLVIWTTPPGPAELQAALETVSPQQVVLFGIDPSLDRLDPFLRRLAGLAKHGLKAKGGRVILPTLAAATAQRERTVRAGLDWLVAHGDLVIVATEEVDGQEVLHLAAGNGKASPALPEATARLRALLAETAAYRAHFARTPSVLADEA